MSDDFNVNDILIPEEGAKLLGIEYRDFLSLLRQKIIPSRRAGFTYVTTRQAVQHYANNNDVHDTPVSVIL